MANVSAAAQGLDEASPRIALYAHDTFGLGHSRRTALIARALREQIPTAAILLISGSVFARPRDVVPGIDHLTLPTLEKQPSGGYRSKTLAITTEALVALRSGVIDRALETFDPDVFIVDNVPRGVMNELDAALRRLRATQRTRCILGLRDVLDAPERLRDEWQARRNHEAIDEHYDHVWVYGDRLVHDVGEVHTWPASTLKKTEYIGYLDPTRRRQPNHERSKETILGMVGGGGDGEVLARAFVDPKTDVSWAERVLLTGPHLHADVRSELTAMASGQPRLSIVDHHEEPETLLDRAHRVVTMGGYNSLMEVLSFRIPALVIPRVAPREEQRIRAEAFSRLGLVEVALPDEVNGERIRSWLERSVPRPDPRAVLDMGGLERVSDAVARMLHTRPDPIASFRNREALRE
jgi:predicted glycosyltransferase